LEGLIDQEYLDGIKTTMRLIFQYPDELIPAMRLAFENICVKCLNKEKETVRIRFVNLGQPISI
jgi:hypothetical protein